MVSSVWVTTCEVQPPGLLLLHIRDTSNMPVADHIEFS